MTNKVYDLLTHLGITANYTGYYYTAYAVKLAVESPRELLLVTKRLYPDVAKHFSTTSLCVERNIRTVVELAWDRHADLLDKMANYELPTRPSASQFIAILAAAIASEEAAEESAQN